MAIKRTRQLREFEKTDFAECVGLSGVDSHGSEYIIDYVGACYYVSDLFRSPRVQSG